MATRGAKPNPASRRTDPDRHTRMPPGEVREIERPDEMLSTEGADIWDAVVPTLANAGVLMPTDLPLLVEMVEAIAFARDYRRALRDGMKRGTVTEYNRQGEPYEVDFIGSPTEKRLRAGWKAAIDSAEKIASEFGLTPTARARLGVMANAKKDALHEALQEGDS